MVRVSGLGAGPHAPLQVEPEEAVVAKTPPVVQAKVAEPVVGAPASLALNEDPIATYDVEEGVKLQVAPPLAQVKSVPEATVQ